MSPLGDVLGKAAGDAVESTMSKARLLVLRALDFCRVATVEELPAHVRPTLIALAKCADATGVCWPSYRVLAEYTGRTRRTVIRHVAQLGAFVSKELRYFVGNRSPEQPHNRSNKYRVHVPERAPRGRRTTATATTTSTTTTPATTAPVTATTTTTETPATTAPARPTATPATTPLATTTPVAASCAAPATMHAAEHIATSVPPSCAGQALEPETPLSPKAEAVLHALQATPLLSAVANGADAARLWGLASAERRTVADIERAIAELVKKSPTGVRWSRERAWGRVTAFVERARATGGDSPETQRTRAHAELRKDAEERRRDEEARRGTVPIPATIKAELRERGLLSPRPP